VKLDRRLVSIALGLIVLVARLLVAQLAAQETAPRKDAATPNPIVVDTKARSLQPGELVLYTITVPTGGSDVTVAAFDRTIRAIRSGGDTWLALVGIDLTVKPGTFPTTVTATLPAGKTSATHSLTVEPKQFPTRRLTVNPAMVNPPPTALDRIKREQEKISSAYRSPAMEALWSGPFARPVLDAANSRFGSRSVFNKTRSSPHTGADFSSPAGTPIKAPNRGRVRLAEDLYYSGNTVILDHGLGLFSLFAHLSAFKVQEGDIVATGDVVGLVGATGRVTGPHLHWAVRATGARIDPLSLLAVLGEEEMRKD
jgi:murein DD-endopeptidase MepM/ murein hydrolase activator NlpD